MGELGVNATVKVYPTGYHMLLRDLNAEPRWADIANWVEYQAKTRGTQMMMAAE
jgi:alpha-beta hydrolase superfamily lysophospholipase